MPIRAAMFAAGVGARLGPKNDKPPKALLEFGGKTLLARHIELLARADIPRLDIAVGYQEDRVIAEATAVAEAVGGIEVHFFQNPRFTEGSIITMKTLAPSLRSGDDILMMDADVLYDFWMLAPLLTTQYRNALLYDGDFIPGDEPVKICVRNGVIVDFAKQVTVDFEHCGESVGFFRFSHDVADDLARLADEYDAAGRGDEMYEEAIRELVFRGPSDRFGYEDVSGVPWIEIDFPEDVIRAETEILPKLQD